MPYAITAGFLKVGAMALAISLKFFATIEGLAYS
jgi:hypothetical protein